MIITRSPLRISLGGGGTDLPSYYRQHGGFLIAGAIDKHVYISMHRSFHKGLTLRYSKIETVTHRSQIQHPILREALALYSVDDDSIEISSLADLPAGTGLGSSGSFGTALVRAIFRYQRRSATPRELAEAACHLEIDVLREPVGKQDQFAAAYGGINCYTFRDDDSVEVEPLAVSAETLASFYERVLLFSTGASRSASAILQEQDTKTQAASADMIANLHEVKDLGFQSKRALELGDLDAFGRLLHTHWERKKKRSNKMSTDAVDRWYEVARGASALGGKLIGAGGGGVLMFCASDPTQLRRALAKEGLSELRFSFDYHGTSLVAD